MGNKVEQKVAEVVDQAAGAGTTDKIRGKVDKVVGETKNLAGKAIGDTELQAEGIAQKAKGSGEEAVGQVRSTAAIIVDVVKEGALIVSDSVNHILHRDKPADEKHTR